MFFFIGTHIYIYINSMSVRVGLDHDEKDDAVDFDLPCCHAWLS